MPPSPAPVPMPGWIVVAIFASFPVVFVFLWLVAGWVGAHVGGWTRLAREFRANAPLPKRNRFGSVAATMGWANYRGGVTLLPGEDGLWLAMSVAFRFAHPTLWIPWTKVSPVETRRGAFGREFFEFSIQSVSGPVKIAFYFAPLAKALSAARETHLGAPDES